MKRLKLNNGMTVQVDGEDYEYLRQWKWGYSNSGYAYRILTRSTDGLRSQRILYMHRLLAKTPPDLQTDHVNRDKLDNRKSNLRVVTRSGNNHNRPLQSNNTSGYKGITWNKKRVKWQVYKDNHYIGLFANLEEAVAARR